ncbi:MAG TPA: hypothetical protein VK498_02305 [Ferruginibacter sp.]|nr:hypothetical protein [Ferruginibacter sp.]
MSEPLATYSFLPWLRQGLANNITQGDKDNLVKLRASITINLTVTATSVNGTDLLPTPLPPKTIELYGPGDIVGIDSRAIVKTEPRNWITNFEPNYLPYIEFYPEDFAWRYTPARPEGDRLRPWLTLVVLKEDEFEDGQNIKEKPLPFFRMKDGKSTTGIFPKPAELWAWAHVHVNEDLSNDAAPNAADAGSVNTAITNLIQQNPDHAYSRIVCPRKLETKIGYHAFLIPTFESGRLAGLGLPLDAGLTATECGWENAANIEFPYYHRWYFRTGDVGDFEYLVNLLQPRPADKKVGIRDIDVLHPGSNLPPITNTDLNGVLKLGGALKVPFDTLKEEDKVEVRRYDEWDENPYPHEFNKAIARMINLADAYADASKTVDAVNGDAGIPKIKDENNNMVNDPDPVITTPLYGRWHALQQRLLKDKANVDLKYSKNWVHELNLDPRFRVAAGLGTKVVQKGQEEYMQAAWEQVGKIVEANNKIRMAQLAKEVSAKFYTKHITSLITEKAFLFTAPVQKRIMYQNLTVYKQVEESVVPAAITSGTFRNITRPRGSTMKKMAFTSSVHANNLVERINNGEVIIVPLKTDPKGAINLTEAATQVKPVNIPGTIDNLLKKYKWFKYLPLIVLLVLLLVVLLFFRTVAGGAVFGAGAIGLVWLYNKFNKWDKEIKQAESVSRHSQVPEAVDNYPSSPNFVVSAPGSGFKPSAGSTDSEEAKNFKIALKDVFTLVNTKFPDLVRKELNFADITAKVVKSLNPAFTIPKRTLGTVKIPGRLRDNMVEQFAPVMAYPEIDMPMYKPLSEMSSELFLPNINLIEQNSITLLENNQKFIESYMVGINHEMSRELLWREFPTDQRGSYFRQFWDVTSFLPPQPVPPDIKERLRDIPRIHEWSRINENKTDLTDPGSPRKNELGQHNLRALTSGKTQLVLVIRGELLKKYPTAVVYAHKADWGLKKNSETEKDIKEERRFAELSDAEKINPPLSKIKTPLFEAKVEPDIYFFGFDLDDEEARGTLNPDSLTDDPGWFFVIKERPGEPRFGLDIGKAKNENGLERLINWNNLSWKDIETADGSCIEINKTITFDTYDAAADQENNVTADDVQARWSPDTDAAELAYILYQVPVLVGVHASRMLPK